MEVFGYISLILMGVTLGLIGAGGSILTIPIFLYMFDMPMSIATSYSLVIVCFSAFMASLPYLRVIKFRKAINFAIPSILGVFIVRYFVIPNLPLSFGIISLKQVLVILLLIFIMLAGYLMIKNPRYDSKNDKESSILVSIKIWLVALLLGSLMGLLGVGGGVLIVPTLVAFMGFAMQDAVPTSLFIIILNSFIGFVADEHHLIQSDWINLGKYLICAFFGILIGLYMSKFIRGENLKKIFGYLIYLVGIAIFVKEFII